MSLVWAVQDLHMGGQEAGMEPVPAVLYGKPRGSNREERGSQEEARRQCWLSRRSGTRCAAPRRETEEGRVVGMEAHGGNGIKNVDLGFTLQAGGPEFASPREARHGDTCL